MKESIGIGGRKAGSPDGTGVGPGLSKNMGISLETNSYLDGSVSDDNVMSSGNGGYARAVKKEEHKSVGGGFTINGKM